MSCSAKSLYVTLSLSSITLNLTPAGLVSLSLDAVSSSTSHRLPPSYRGSSEFESR